jgi:chromosome segregation ATPase
MISEARSERRSAESYNASLRRAIAQQRSQLSSINAARKAGRNVRGDSSRLERNIDSNLTQMNRELKRKDAVLVEAKQTLNEAEPSASKQQLQAEYNSLNKEKQILQAQIRQMNGVKQDLAVASR